MKALSRSYVYWASLDRNIEEVCRSCAACRAVRDAPPRAQLHPWEFPLHPWQRVHADFADCGGVRYLVIVDAHSKWIEALPMRGTNAAATINVFRSTFARFGLPSQLVTDNGPPFSSQEFKFYCEKNCIKHTTSAPYRPQGNGAAENAVKTIKKAIKRAMYEGDDVNVALSKFLLQYRNCEHATTRVSPAVALQGRRLRSRLDALRPDVAAAVRAKQERQVARTPGTDREFHVGDAVIARDYSARGDKWTEATVVKKTGPISYKVSLGNGVEWRRHADQIIPASSKNRFSLSRVSDVVAADAASSGAACPGVESGADGEVFEDASSGGADTEDPPPQRVQPERLPLPVSPPPQGASARALRAINRAKKAAM
ncbi:hypothetical protein PYW07_008100 [Mythimna separata]|uniref:Integrase catalytic domain-containing protein n=1 Tax=Mythimna separata TaxID=271217 RepID=A0AAD7YPM1_MYTSE|nr:hypothetical protein PYW07_008100 [Mythimna separata]